MRLVRWAALVGIVQNARVVPQFRRGTPAAGGYSAATRRLRSADSLRERQDTDDRWHEAGNAEGGGDSRALAPWKGAQSEPRDGGDLVKRGRGEVESDGAQVESDGAKVESDGAQVESDG